MKRVCVECAAEFNKSPAQIARGEGRFCSNVCRNAYKSAHIEERSGERAPKWRGGVWQENRRQRSRDYTKIYRDRGRAYDAVKLAIRKGTLKKEPCARCGAIHEYVHAHHSDYSKPLDVIWLCPSCHAKQHGLSEMMSLPQKPRNRERQYKEREASKMDKLASTSAKSSPNPA